MPDPPGHPAIAALATIAMMATPMLLLTAGVIVIAVISSCSRSDARREHARKVIADLTAFARVLRARPKA